MLIYLEVILCPSATSAADSVWCCIAGFKLEMPHSHTAHIRLSWLYHVVPAL